VDLAAFSLPVILLLFQSRRFPRATLVMEYMSIQNKKSALARASILLCLICANTLGEEEPPELKADIAYPVFYSISLMAVGFPILMAADVFEDEPRLRNFERAWTSAPRWDDDSALFNFALHPLWGSETYLRARESRWGVPGSIAFSLAMSATWEYLIESWVQHPSTQDLIFTTGLGAPLGELRYQLKRRTSDRTDWFLDPIHKTLEHVRLAISRDKDGKVAAGFHFSVEF
jgi:hypothetical protein